MATKEDIAKAAQDIVKRYAAGHKAAIGKVAHHLGLAKAAHAKGMGALKKAAGCMVEAHKIGKAADAGALSGHISAAHGHFGDAADHMDDMEAHLGKALSAWGSSTETTSADDPGGAISVPGLTELTEGHVSQYDADSEYGKLVKLIAGGGMVTKEQAEAMAKAAAEKAATDAKIEALTKSVETLSRLPNGAPKVRTFDFDKAPIPGMGGEADTSKLRMGALLEGVSLDMQDEGEFTKAAGGMIANMIKNGPRLAGPAGKPVLFGAPPMFDPNFHGRGGTGR